MNPFDYNSTKTDFTINIIDSNKHRARYSVTFPVARPTAYIEQNTAHGEYYKPQGVQDFPLAIVVHGLGDSSTMPCRMIARDLAKKGIASFIIYLVFHSRRMPETIRDKLPYLSQDEWYEGYRTSVVDIRQVLDWAQTVPEINKNKISIIGISLGGIISAISMGIDKRISAGVFLVAGGNYESRTWLKRGRNTFTDDECARAQEAYRKYLAEVAETGFQNVQPARQSYLTDPVTYAYLLTGRPTLMLNASWDERIPKQSSLDLWQACNKPQIVWYPATHASIWIWYPLIFLHILHFLQSNI